MHRSATPHDLGIRFFALVMPLDLFRRRKNRVVLRFSSHPAARNGISGFSPRKPLHRSTTRGQKTCLASKNPIMRRHRHEPEPLVNGGSDFGEENHRLRGRTSKLQGISHRDEHSARMPLATKRRLRVNRSDTESVATDAACLTAHLKSLAGRQYFLALIQPKPTPHMTHSPIRPSQPLLAFEIFFQRKALAPFRKSETIPFDPLQLGSLFQPHAHIRLTVDGSFQGSSRTLGAWS